MASDQPGDGRNCIGSKRKVEDVRYIYGIPTMFHRLVDEPPFLKYSKGLSSSQKEPLFLKRWLTSMVYK